MRGGDGKRGEGGAVVEILIGFSGQNSRSERFVARKRCQERLQDRS